MKITSSMKNALPAKYFGLTTKREYPMAVIVGGKPKWDKRHAALAKGRAKQQYDRGYLTTTQYNRIINKADKVLSMRVSRSMKANTIKRRNSAVRMDTTFDSPEWQESSRKESLKRIAKKKTRPKTNPSKSQYQEVADRIVWNYLDREFLNFTEKDWENKTRYHIKNSYPKYSYTKLIPLVKKEAIRRQKQYDKEVKYWKKHYAEWNKKYGSKNSKRKNSKRKNSTVPMGSSTGGGYMLAMRGLREGDYAENVPLTQANRQYIPTGYSGSSGNYLGDKYLVAGKQINPRKTHKKGKAKTISLSRKKGWFRFALFAKSGKKLGTRIGQGSKTEADKAGQKMLGKKSKGRIIQRVVVDGPYKNKPN